MTDDTNYDIKDQQRAERIAKRRLRMMNYREADVKCCLNCKLSSRMSLEDPLECKLIRHSVWAVGYVEDLNVCDGWIETNDTEKT